MMCYLKGFYFGSSTTFPFSHVSNENREFLLNQEDFVVLEVLQPRVMIGNHKSYHDGEDKTVR